MKKLHDYGETIGFTGQHKFVLADHIRHPLFWWPQTLLGYRMDFSAVKIWSEKELALVEDETGEEQAFQLSDVVRAEDGTVKTAKIHFLSDLPSGGKRSFTLEKRAGKTFAKAVKSQREGNSIWLKGENFSVKLPLSQAMGNHVPGPYEAFEFEGIRYGSSELICGKKEFLDLQTECKADGPLYSEYEMTYRFSRGGEYHAVVRVIKSMDFIEFEEEIKDLDENDGVYFRFNWNGLNPTHRHAPNNPAMIRCSGDAHCYESYNWQTIDQELVESTNHPLPMWGNLDGEIPFKLSSYEPQAAVARATNAAFWNKNTGISAGTFITDVEAWNSGRYDIYCSWNGFAVKFFYENGLLWWQYPIISGVRKTAVTVYCHEKDREYFLETLPKKEIDRKYLSGGTGIAVHGASYVTFLQNRYELITLNRIKDFVLEYPRDKRRLPRIRPNCAFVNWQEFVEYLFSYILVQKLPTHGQTENSGFHAVPYRRVSGLFFDAYNCLWETMPEEQRERVEAVLLLVTYLGAGEDLAPIMHVLGGPPNLHGDVKRSIPYISALFPEHPHVKRWGEIFRKSYNLLTRFSTRPDLDAIQLTGGRWAENIGTYTWAFWSDAIYSCMMLEQYHGFSNIVANKYAAMVAKWLVYSLTAPFEGEKPETAEYFKEDGHFWGCFKIGEGPHRVHLPLGAHSARRTVPSSLFALADHLDWYSPLLAENIRYVCPGFTHDFERFDDSGNKPRSERERLESGTRPDYRTQAFTGMGVMFRSAVYTPDEMSVFLQQVDEGPNYRWGTSGGWGNGNIYYYAGGKAYSHNGMEDVGDRRLNDCDVGCNFGVWYKGSFKNIGPNVLTNGFHDLGVFQYAALSPDKQPPVYAYPEYQERSVLVSGKDYISIFDITGGSRNATRFSWSVHANDEFPEIYMLSFVENRAELTTQNKKERIKTRWYDGRGNGYAVVTHRHDLHVEGMEKENGAVVTGPDFRDILFRSEYAQESTYEDVSFEGKVGAVRQKKEKTELA
ncbi:MAG: hypothetical protein ACOX6P_11845, partial [Candidatus Merdivicinus sp.]